MVRYDEFGREVHEDGPMEVPVGFDRPPSLQEEIARYIRAESALAAREGKETEEESNDFAVGDDHVESEFYSRHEYPEDVEMYHKTILGKLDLRQGMSPEEVYSEVARALRGEPIGDRRGKGGGEREGVERARGGVVEALSGGGGGESGKEGEFAKE